MQKGTNIQADFIAKNTTKQVEFNKFSLFFQHSIVNELSPTFTSKLTSEHADKLNHNLTEIDYYNLMDFA